MGGDIFEPCGDLVFLLGFFDAGLDRTTRKRQGDKQVSRSTTPAQRPSIRGDRASTAKKRPRSATRLKSHQKALELRLFCNAATSKKRLVTSRRSSSSREIRVIPAANDKKSPQLHAPLNAARSTPSYTFASIVKTLKTPVLRPKAASTPPTAATSSQTPPY